MSSESMDNSCSINIVESAMQMQFFRYSGSGWYYLARGVPIVLYTQQFVCNSFLLHTMCNCDEWGTEFSQWHLWNVWENGILCFKSKEHR